MRWFSCCLPIQRLAQGFNSREATVHDLQTTVTCDAPGLPLRESSAANSSCRTFTFEELNALTNNFAEESLLGIGGFGRVYKGNLEGQDVAVKRQIHPSEMRSKSQFREEVKMLSRLRHPNIIQMIGYCQNEHEWLIVYEFMPQGSLDLHLFHRKIEHTKMRPAVLDWKTRMKIAGGVAIALQYLIRKAKPPVIFTDLKPENILLGTDYNPKLSDFGMANDGPVDGDTEVHTSSVLGTLAYCEPEYRTTANLRPNSDIYAFGLVLLELIMGRRNVDQEVPIKKLLFQVGELVKAGRHSELADPMLNGGYSSVGLERALITALDCVKERNNRPDIDVVVEAMAEIESLECDRST